MIKIGNVELASVADAGTLNFFGDGWWYHKFLKVIHPFSFNFSDLSGWIAKTTPFDFRRGNTEINELTLQPKEKFPDCVFIDKRKGIILNAAGVSSPGLPSLLGREGWQKATKTFGISIITVGDTPKERLDEIRKIVILIKAYQNKFQAPFFIEEDLSCPSVKCRIPLTKEEILKHLHELKKIGVPVSAKFNALIELEIIRAIEENKVCDWISLGNTIPFGRLPDQIDWISLFGTADANLSPLAHYGGGGLSGSPLVSVYCNCIRNFREAGITIPILGGGGLGCSDKHHFEEEIDLYLKAGANALHIASVAALKPSLVKPTIQKINEKFG